MPQRGQRTRSSRWSDAHPGRWRKASTGRRGLDIPGIQKPDGQQEAATTQGEYECEKDTSSAGVGPPDALKGCAVSRTEGIATRGGRSSGSMTPRRTTHLDPKGRGDKSMLGKRGTAEDVYAVVLQRLSDTAKTGLFASHSPGVEPHTRWQHI